MSQIWLLIGMAIALAAALIPRADTSVSNIAIDLRAETLEIALFAGICAVILVWLYRTRFMKWVDEKNVPRGYPPDATRHFTTRMHFEFAAMVYCGTGLAILALLFFFPREVVVLACAADSVFKTEICIEQAGIVSFTWLPMEENTQPRTLSALALGFAASLGFLTLPRIEELLRDALQKAALIPERARSLESALLDDFKRFHPGPVREFLDDFNARGDGPRLYPADFADDLQNEYFLEIYPRLEFFLDRMAALSPSERTQLGASRFTDDLAVIEGEMKVLRAAIREASEATRRMFGTEFAEIVEKAHHDKGFNLPKGAPYAVTVLDDIVRGVQAATAPASTDTTRQAKHKRETRALAEFMSGTLKSLRATCETVHRKLIQIVVLLSLRSPGGPARTLAHFGLSGKIDRLEVELLPWMVIGTVALSFFAVLAVHQALGLDIHQMETFLHAMVMPSAGMLGGYLMASQSCGNWRTLERSSIMSRAHGLHLMLAVFLGGVLTTALALTWLPADSFLKPGALISPAFYFTPVSGIYGCFVAHMFIRQSRDQAIVRKSDWIRWPVLAALALWLSRLLFAIVEQGDMTRAISWKQQSDFSNLSELQISIGLSVVTAIGAAIYVAMAFGLVAYQDWRHRAAEGLMNKNAVPKPDDQDKVVVFTTQRSKSDVEPMAAE